MLSYCVSNQKESFTFLGIPSNDEVLLKHTFEIKAKLDWIALLEIEKYLRGGAIKN